jgi:two-component system, OmpR family, sensor histidine kinase MprB
VTGPLPAMRRPVEAVDRRWHGAPLSTRLTSAAAFAATFAIVAVVAVAYVAVRHELLSNIDSQLRRQVSEIKVTPQIGETGLPLLRVDTHVGDVGGYAQIVNAAGTPQRAMGQSVTLPVTAADVQVASHGVGSTYHDAVAGGLHLRILTKPLAGTTGLAVQIALPLTATDSQLHKLRLAFLLLALLGLGLVVSGSWFVVRRTMRPVASLTNAAERIAVTRDLTTRIEDYGADELGRLASTFNIMLDALERSVGQQRQLILDASHELRTPLASLRTNVEVLHDVERLSVDQRRSLLDGIVTQLDELTGLVADVVELARGDAPESAQEDVALEDLVSQAVERARRHWPNVIFMLDAEPVTVRGVPSRLDRAVANLLDNAGKFSPSGSVVDTTLTADGLLTVADRGPGVPEEAVEFVFDRFYRADEARSMPGSGLGLAIVKQVVDGHHGTVTLRNRAGGGTIVSVTLSPLPEPSPAVPLFEAQVIDTQPVS